MTATLPPHSQVRDCRLYRIRVYHPDDMRLPAEQRRVVLGYVGETLRQPLVRLMEHINDQPWSDTIVGWDLDPRVFAGKNNVLAAEAAAIRAELPLYNVKGNERNRHRIIPPVAIRQRRARDAENRAARWVHPDDRSTPMMPDRRVSVPRKWTPLQVKVCLWSSAWALTVTATLAGFGHFAVSGLWWQHLIAASVSAGLLLAWSLAGAPVSKRQWRKARRRGLGRWLKW